MATAEAIRQVSEKAIPSSRRPKVSKALLEVKKIKNGNIPRKSARSFLKEMRED